MAVNLFHADTQGKANSRFLDTVVRVDISQNLPSFSCIVILGRALDSIVPG